MVRFHNSKKSNHLQLFSFLILILWIISPLIEFFFFNYHQSLYTSYFRIVIYLIGFMGLFYYLIYLFQLKEKQKLNLKQFIPEILLLILLSLSIIATILSNNSYLSFFGESYRNEGLLVYVMYIGVILLASIIKDTKYIKYLAEGMIIVCLIITTIPLLKNDFTFFDFANVFHNTNHYGYYLMINTMLAIFMFINNKKLFKQVLYAIIYIFFLYLLIRNDTFGSYLAIFATLIFLLIYSIIKKYQIKKIIIIILLFITTSFLVSFYDIKIGEKVHFENTKGIVLRNILFLKHDIKGYLTNDEKIINKAGSYRGTLWREALKYTLKHPLVGGGMECLRDYYISDIQKPYNEFNDRPHNCILQVSSFIGIPGAIIYIIFISYIALANLPILKNNHLHIMIYSTAMCYFISSLFGNSMYYTSPYFMILLGLLIGYLRHQKLDLAK